MTKEISSEEALSVSELVNTIKNQLEVDFSDLYIEGEVSNLTQSSTGHWYFSVADSEASLSCCLFRGQATHSPQITKLKDGDKVRLNGNISVYAKRTSIQLIVKKLVSMDTKGSLKEKFEKLKNALSQEGLFDLNRKKKIPNYVKNIAVITAENGAALQDFLTVMKRRSLEFSIHLYPSVVQGDTAAPALIKALNNIERHGNYDVVVITRGGGSQEDLWCFNNEDLVRKIATMTMPVVSAVGHEVDYTLCDFVADLRCETPTAAAEILSSKQLKILEQFNILSNQLRSYATRKKQFVAYLIESLRPSYQIKFLQNICLRKISDLNKLQPKIDGLDRRIYSQQVQLEQSVERISQAISRTFEAKQNLTQRWEAKLSALDPFKVLNRGYSILSTDADNIITSKDKLAKISSKAKIFVRFSDGSAELIKP